MFSCVGFHSGCYALFRSNYPRTEDIPFTYIVTCDKNITSWVSSYRDSIIEIGASWEHHTFIIEIWMLLRISLLNMPHVLLQDQMQCDAVLTVYFLQIYYNRHPIACLWGWVMRCFCEFKVSSVFYWSSGMFSVMNCSWLCKKSTWL